jgi:DeoR family suf operon transcriptional repressor
MNMHLDDNPTRNSIIQLLKKSGGLSIEDLSKSILITPMGIRQHLLSLEKKGIVTYVARKHGIGRPGFVYMLTDKADALFPKSYDKFAIEILNDIKKYEGPEKLDTIFKWRKDKQLKTFKDAFAGVESVDDSVKVLKNMLESEGHIVELTRNNGNYHLKQYNCPISKVASEFKNICAYELQLYREVFGEGVTVEQNISEGAPSCFYKIPAN